MFHLPHTLVDQCIAVEELAWQEDRGKMEVRAKESEDGSTLLYSLHRVDNGSSVPQLESRLPPQQVRVERHGAEAPFSRSESYKRGAFRKGMNSSRGGPSQFAPPPSRSEYGDRWNRYPEHDRPRQFESQSMDRRRDYPRGSEDYGRDRREDRRGGASGSSQAEERVRQVEARIMKDRERGNRGGFINQTGTNSSSPSSSDRLFHGKGDSRSHRADAVSRWSNAEPSFRGGAAYEDRRRDYSPPSNRRNYPERSRVDDIDRIRNRRD